MGLLRTSAVVIIGAGIFLGPLGPRAEAETRIVGLNGFDEVPVVITDATGTLRVSIPAGQQSIDYILSYEGIEGGDVLQAHIHLGQRHTTGAIVVFLCTNVGGAPVSLTHPTPSCPASPSTLFGTLDASNVIERSAQGVGPGDLAAVIGAIRKGVAYANVHTTGSPSGEIRGQFHGPH